jgi:hypothetical protein
VEHFPDGSDRYSDRGDGGVPTSHLHRSPRHILEGDRFILLYGLQLISRERRIAWIVRHAGIVRQRRQADGLDDPIGVVLEGILGLS